MESYQRLLRPYNDLLHEILDKGKDRPDRTGTGVRGLFGRQIRFDLTEGFPLMTTKKLHLKSIIYELLWFLRGDTNTRYLNENGVSIWDEWADDNGDLGPVYGRQWRSWPTQRGDSIDQLSQVVDEIKKNPCSRRLIVSAWNVGELDKMALPPCHCLFQFYVHDGHLSCQLYQRSADIFLGVPFNIASYALLTHMVAYVCDLKVGEFIHTFGDVHLYHNHLEQARQLLKREAEVKISKRRGVKASEDLPLFSLPKITLSSDTKDLFSFTRDDIQISNYHPAAKIAAPVAV